MQRVSSLLGRPVGDRLPTLGAFRCHAVTLRGFRNSDDEVVEDIVVTRLSEAFALGRYDVGDLVPIGLLG